MKRIPNILRKVTVIVALFLASTAMAQAPIQANPTVGTMTPRQREILQTVMNPEGGIINRQLHSEFWQPILLQAGKITQREQNTIKTEFEASMGSALAFQRETWASAAASARSRKLVYTAGYAVARHGAINPPFAGLPVDRPSLEQAAANGDRVVQAAASGAVLNVGSKSLYITEELANRVLEGLEGSMARAMRLMNPEWSDNQIRKEYKYDDMRLAILTEEPFNKGQDKSSVSGSEFRLTRLSRDLSPRESVTVATSPIAGGLKPEAIQETVRRVAVKNLEAMSATLIGTPVSGNFRGANSTTINGRTVADGQPVAISVRIAYRSKHSQLLQVMAFAPDILKAIVLREALEQDLRLLED